MQDLPKNPKTAEVSVSYATRSKGVSDIRVSTRNSLFTSNAFFYAAGIVFLALAKIKHTLEGYKTPKPFSLNDTQRCIDYDLRVGDYLLTKLTDYRGSISGRKILELGPGSDVGVGIYFIAKGASEYVAFDRHPLADKAPEAFYSAFADRLQTLGLQSRRDRVTFVSRDDFDIAAVPEAQNIDVVISNASFEHFDDVETTVKRLSRVVRSGGILVAAIDLQTHSRWIRDADPNNIYRYPEWLYRLFHFSGQPNRVRPDEYRRIFESHNWTRISIAAGNRLDPHMRKRRVHRKFSEDQYLRYVSIILCATKK
jgi:SAM-dependent methyltransferase